MLSSPFVNVEGIAHTVERAERFEAVRNLKERDRLNEIERQIKLVKEQILEWKNLYHQTANIASSSVLIFPSQWTKELGFIHDINVSPDAVTKEVLMVHRTLPLDDSFISNVWRWTIKENYSEYVIESVVNELVEVYSENYQRALNGFISAYNYYKPKDLPSVSVDNISEVGWGGSPENWKDVSLPEHWEMIKKRYIPGNAWNTDGELEQVEDDVTFLDSMRKKIRRITGENVSNKASHPVDIIFRAVRISWESKLSQYIEEFFDKDVQYSNFPLTSLITDAVYDRYLMFITNKKMSRDDLYLIEGQEPPPGVSSVDRSMTQFTRPSYWEEAAKRMKMFYSVFVHDGSRDILDRVLFRDDSTRKDTNADDMGRPVDLLYHDEMTWISEHAPDGETELKNQLVLLFHMWAIGKRGTVVQSADDLSDEIAERAKKLAIFFIKRCYIPESIVQKWFTSDSYIEGFFFQAKILPYLREMAKGDLLGLKVGMTPKEMISVFYRKVFFVIMSVMLGITTVKEESGSYLFLTEIAAKRGVFEGEERVSTEGLYTIDNVPVEERNKFLSLPDHRWVRDKLLDYMITIVRGRFSQPFFEESESTTTFLRKINNYESYFKRWRNYYEQFYELFRQNRQEIESRFNQRLPLKDDAIRLGVAISKGYSDLYGLESRKEMIEGNKKYVPVNVRINRPPVDYPINFQYVVDEEVALLRENPINTEAGVFDMSVKRPLELSGNRRLEMRVDISLKPSYYAQLMNDNRFELERVEVIWVQMRKEVREKGKLVFPKVDREIQRTVETELPVSVKIGLDLYGTEDYTGLYKVIVKSRFYNRASGESEEFENRSNWVATIDERLFCVRCKKYFNRYMNPFGVCKWNERRTKEYVKAMEAYRMAKGTANNVMTARLEERLEEAKGRMPYLREKLWIDRHSEINEFHDKADRERGVHGSYIDEEWGYNFEAVDRLLTEAYKEYEMKLQMKKDIEMRMTSEEDVKQLNQEFREWKMKHSKFHRYQVMFNQMQEAQKNPLKTLIGPENLLGRYQSLSAALRGIKT